MGRAVDLHRPIHSNHTPPIEASSGHSSPPTNHADCGKSKGLSVLMPDQLSLTGLQGRTLLSNIPDDPTDFSEKNHYTVSYINESTQQQPLLPLPEGCPSGTYEIGAGYKVYECIHCNYRCSAKTHMHYHVRKHTGVQPFLCKVCGQRFSVKSNLVRHVKTKHKEAVSAGNCRVELQDHHFI